MRPLKDWLQEYALSHTNATNQAIHFVCVPLIYFTVFAFLYCVPLYVVGNGLTLTLAHVAFLFVAIYFLILSPSIGIGMILYTCLCLITCMSIQFITGGYLGWIALAIFITAWAFQFWGHSVEGRKPSFFKDVQFLLIGPMWVLSKVYSKAGLNVN